MKKNPAKRVISFLLVMSMLFSIGISATAYQDSASEYSEAECYELIQSYSTEADKYSMDKLLAICEMTDTYIIGTSNIEIYSVDNLYNIFNDAATIQEVCVMNDFFYITYTANDGTFIILQYDNSGLISQVVHPIDSYSIYIYDGFQVTGYQLERYSMSSELSEYIDNCLNENDLDALKDTPNLRVIEFEDGIAVEEIIPELEEALYVSLSSDASISPHVDGFKDEASLISDLKAHFPYRNNSLMLQTSRYCEFLDCQVNVQVREDRNNYKKVGADWKSFAVGTAVTVIAGVISVPTSVAVSILIYAGVGISAANTITDHVTLYYAAKYSFGNSRYGDCYDTTAYNSYVRAYQYYQKGEFAGGYDSEGDFRWIISEPTFTSSDYEYYKIADYGMRKYNDELFSNGTAIFLTPVK